MSLVIRLSISHVLHPQMDQAIIELHLGHYNDLGSILIYAIPREKVVQVTVMKSTGWQRLKYEIVPFCIIK